MAAVYVPHDGCVWAPADVISESGGGVVVARLRAPADDEPLNRCAAVETTISLKTHADASALPPRAAAAPEAVEDLVALARSRVRVKPIRRRGFGGGLRVLFWIEDSVR